MEKYAYRYNLVEMLWKQHWDDFEETRIQTVSVTNFSLELSSSKQENLKQIRNTRSCLITSAARQFSGDRIFRLNCNTPRRRGNSYSQKVVTPCFLTFLSTVIIRSNLSLIQSTNLQRNSFIIICSYKTINLSVLLFNNFIIRNKSISNSNYLFTRNKNSSRNVKEFFWVRITISFFLIFRFQTLRVVYNFNKFERL